MLLSLGISPSTSPPQLDPAKATASPRKLNNRRRLTARKGQISAKSSTPNQFEPVLNIVILYTLKLVCLCIFTKCVRQCCRPVPVTTLSFLTENYLFFCFRRDPYDYPTHSRPVPREPVPYPGRYNDPPASSHPSRGPLPQAGSQSHNPRYYPSSPSAGQQQRAPLRQDVPPSPTAGRRGWHYYEAAGGRVDGYRQASPGRYASPERYPVARERYTSPERYAYGDERQPDPRRKNPMIGAV